MTIKTLQWQKNNVNFFRDFKNVLTIYTALFDKIQLSLKIHLAETFHFKVL